MIKKSTNKNLKPSLEKIVVNSGVGRLSITPNFEEKILPEIAKEISAITGQKPSYNSAKKSIAGFKLRQGNIVGLKVTLRGKRMLAFLEKLNGVTMPRLRDFQGLKLSSVDTNGNLSIGLKEQIVFPEIVPEQTKVNFGLEITIVPKVADREKAIALYRELGVPLQKN